MIIGAIALAVWLGCGLLGAGWWYGTCIRRWHPASRWEWLFVWGTILVGPCTLFATIMTLWGFYPRPWTWSLRFPNQTWLALHELVGVEPPDGR